MTPELAAARAQLEEAILAVDQAVQDRDGDPRGDNEVLTHWAVVYSFHRADADGSYGTQLADIRSDGLSYWQAAGLYNAAAYVAESEPWAGDSDL